MKRPESPLDRAERAWNESLRRQRAKEDGCLIGRDEEILVPTFEMASNVEFDIRTGECLRYWDHERRKMVRARPRGCLAIAGERPL